MSLLVDHIEYPWNHWIDSWPVVLQSEVILPICPYFFAHGPNNGPIWNSWSFQPAAPVLGYPFLICEFRCVVVFRTPCLWSAARQLWHTVCLYEYSCNRALLLSSFPAVCLSVCICLSDFLSHTHPPFSLHPLYISEFYEILYCKF